MRLPRPRSQHDQLLHRFDSDQVFRQRLPQRAQRRRLWRLFDGRGLIRAVGGPLEQSQFLDIARQGRLRDHKPPRGEVLAKLLLASHGLVLDDVLDGGEALGFHRYASGTDSIHKYTM